MSFLRVPAPTVSCLADKDAGKVNVCKVNIDHVPAVAEDNKELSPLRRS